MDTFLFLLFLDIHISMDIQRYPWISKGSDLQMLFPYILFEQHWHDRKRRGSSCIQFSRLLGKFERLKIFFEKAAGTTKHSLVNLCLVCVGWDSMSRACQVDLLFFLPEPVPLTRLAYNFRLKFTDGVSDLWI